MNENSREEGVSPGKNVALHRRLHPDPVASKTLDDDGVGRRVLALHRVCARVEQVLAVAVQSHSRLSVDVGENRRAKEVHSVHGTREAACGSVVSASHVRLHDVVDDRL